VELEHGLARRRELGTVNLNLEIALRDDEGRPEPDGSEKDCGDERDTNGNYAGSLSIEKIAAKGSVRRAN
jgi:hypothetical protein